MDDFSIIIVAGFSLDKNTWKSRGLRKINIGNYSGFFLVAEKSVRVIRILYGGRDIRTILNLKYSRM